MKKIYILRYQWQIVGVFETEQAANEIIEDIVSGNEKLITEEQRWKPVLRNDFIIMERDMGLFFPIKHMMLFNGAYWIK